MKLSVPFLLALCVVLTSCRSRESSYSPSSSSSSPSSSSSSDSGKLTNEKAQKVIDKFMNKNKGGGCADAACRAEVASVREVPAQNISVVSVKFTDFVYLRKNVGKEYIFSGTGIATFEKFTSGVWSLTKLELMNGGWQWYDMTGYEAQ